MVQSHTGGGQASPTLQARKPMDRLEAEDLAAFHIGEFAEGEEGQPGRDETWVRPIDRRVVDHGMHAVIVAADLTAASGRALVGIVVVSTARQFEVQGQVLLAAGQYLCVEPGEERSRQRVAPAVGMSEPELFPMGFALRAMLAGETSRRRGVLA